ncbi:unnamed protein product, partial [Ectocarpus sp. 12 AP-2014]
ASQVIGWLFHLFETEPPCVTSGNSCPFTHLSSETVLQVHTFLDVGDLGRLSQTSKHMLSLCFDEATWAKLYYRSCTSLDGLLGEKEGGACPVRVMGASGKWFWEGSREAFIRSWEMRKACSSAAFSTAKTQELHVKWELSGLLTVAAGLLYDLQDRRLGDAFPAANAGYLRHMERVLDSLTMRVASLQRLMAWPGVCRGLLSENDEDGSLPIDVWDRPGQQRRSPSPSPPPHEKQHRGNAGAGGGGGGGGGGSHGGDSSGREARLTPEQREAVRLLFGNLAALPAARRRQQQQQQQQQQGQGQGQGHPFVDPEAAAGAAALAAAEAAGAWPWEEQEAAATARTPPEGFPYHHHTVAGPHIPYGMGRVELPARVGGEPPQVLAVADGDDEMDDIGGGAAAAAAAAAASSGCATLQNAQPACGMGGLFWPTLYDLTVAKRRQRERLRECFRKFSRGQRLDVRDPSGVWMGAEVMWAPGDGGVGTLRVDGWGEDGGAGAGAGAAPAAGVAGGGGIQGGGGGGGGPLAGYPVGGDAGMPEWRRLLQLGLMADGGQAAPHPNNNNAAAAAAAAAAANDAAAAAAAATAAAAAAADNVAGGNGGASDGNSSSLGSSNGGDWVTTEAPKAAQSLLASAVASAADSFPDPPRRSCPRRSPPPLLANWNPGAGAALAAVPAGGGAADAAAFGAIAAAAVDQAAPAAGGPAAGALVFGQGGTTPPGSNRKLVRVHYEGHKKKYDEWISVQSGRLAPFRSHTTRPLSVTMQFVEQVVNGASVRSVWCGAVLLGLE